MRLRYSVIATSVVYIITTFHHLYGATVYNTPWRRDVGINGGIVLLVCVVFVYLYKAYRKRVYLLLYLIINFIVFGLGIGIFEGLYNHILKNILFFGGLSLSKWRRLFPAPAYEIPDNFLFEGTGVLQFFAALVLMSYLLRLYRSFIKNKIDQ
ncbi:MAG TPA: hypothetical protein VL727_21125 [Puia sp.]|nr:hypothetical protein [Puia sp.]